MEDKDKTLMELLSGAEVKKTIVKAAPKVKTSSAVTTYSTLKSNNLMNIRYSKAQTWLGETGHSGGFVLFSKPEYSVRAFYKILTSYERQGADTLEKIANKYAPRSDGNNPDTYVRLGKQILLDNDIKHTKDGKVTADMYPYLAKVFLFIESSVDKPVDYFKTIYLKYI